MRKLSEFIEVLKSDIKILESSENYEKCAHTLELIKAIEQRDTKKYIELNFDIESLRELNFFHKHPSIEEAEKAICAFFNIESIFEYSLICPNARYSLERNEL